MKDNLRIQIPLVRPTNRYQYNAADSFTGKWIEYLQLMTLMRENKLLDARLLYLQNL